MIQGKFVKFWNCQCPVNAWNISHVMFRKEQPIETTKFQKQSGCVSQVSIFMGLYWKQQIFVSGTSFFIYFFDKSTDIYVKWSKRICIMTLGSAVTILTPQKWWLDLLMGILQLSCVNVCPMVLYDSAYI